MAVGQKQWYHFGVDTPPISVYFSGDWDVHWGYGLLTHGHMDSIQVCFKQEGASQVWSYSLNARRAPRASFSH